MCDLGASHYSLGAPPWVHFWVALPLRAEPCAAPFIPLPRLPGWSRGPASVPLWPLNRSGNRASTFNFRVLAIALAVPILGLRPPGSPWRSFGVRSRREIAGTSTPTALARDVTVCPCCSIARSIGLRSTDAGSTLDRNSPLALWSSSSPPSPPSPPSNSPSSCSGRSLPSPDLSARTRSTLCQLPNNRGVRTSNSSSLPSKTSR